VCADDQREYEAHAREGHEDAACEGVTVHHPHRLCFGFTGSSITASCGLATTPHRKAVSVQGRAACSALRDTRCLRMIGSTLGWPALNKTLMQKWAADTWQVMVWLASRRSLS
jgi:hypothetical protein